MKTLFIINKARRDEGPSDELIDAMRQRIEQAGRDVDVQLSGSIEESDRLINRGLQDGINALWIGGGDGTINHALNCTFGKDLAYGIVPMGTVNALAQAVGIPLDPLEAVEYLLQAQPVSTDIGQVEAGGKKQYFFTYATVGIHAAVFHNIDTRIKKRWGKLAFWESGIRTVWRKSRLPRIIMELTMAGPDSSAGIVRDYGYSFTLSNMANYFGYGSFTDAPPASPGYFELHSFRRNKILPMFAWFARLRLFGKDESLPESGVEIRRVTQMHVRSHRRISVQLDGEPLKPKPTELTFSCLRNSVKLLLQPHDAQKLESGT